MPPSPGLQGINFAGYSQWPSFQYQGRTLYEIPGAPGYAYNPYVGARGVYGPDPRAQQSAKEEEAKKAAGNPLVPAAVAIGGAGATGLATVWGAKAAGLWGSGSSATTAVPAAAPASAGVLSTGVPVSGIGSAGGAAASSVPMAAADIVTGAGAGAGAGTSTLAAPTIISATRVPAGAAAGAEGAGILSGAAPYLGAAGAALGAYQLAEGYGKGDEVGGALSGATTGAGIGTMIAPGVGTLIGAGIGAIAGAGLGSIKTGRNKDNKLRSHIRDALAKAGVVDRTTDLGGTLDPSTVSNPSGTYVQLADGTYFDISTDAKTKGYNLSDPGAAYSGQAVLWAQPLAALLTQRTNDNAPGWFTAYLSNAIMSNAAGNPEVMRANAQAIAQRMGINPEQAKSELDKMVADKVLDAQKAQVYKNGIDQLVAGDPSTYIKESILEGEVRLGVNKDGKSAASGASVQPPSVANTQPYAPTPMPAPTATPTPTPNQAQAPTQWSVFSPNVQVPQSPQGSQWTRKLLSAPNLTVTPKGMTEKRR